MKKTFLGIIFFSLMVSTTLHAQEEATEMPESLKTQYENMIDNSETFQQYKVIPIVKMAAFKQSLADTLSRYKSNIENISNEKNAIAENNDSLQQKVSQVNIELAETQKLVDGIQIFGATLTKSTYNVIMLSIIIGLIILLVFLYLTFLNAQRLARQAKNDKLRLDNELEDLRKTAHDKQVKVKRELQTALNKIDELSK